MINDDDDNDDDDDDVGWEPVHRVHVSDDHVGRRAAVDSQSSWHRQQSQEAVHALLPLGLHEDCWQCCREWCWRPPTWSVSFSVCLSVCLFVCLCPSLRYKVVWIFVAPGCETSKTLRPGSYSFTCKQHHACLYLVGVHQVALPPATQSRSGLRPSSSDFSVPRTRTKFGERAFCYAARLRGTHCRAKSAKQSTLLLLESC